MRNTRILLRLLITDVVDPIFRIDDTASLQQQVKDGRVAAVEPQLPKNYLQTSDARWDAVSPARRGTTRQVSK